GLFGYSLLTCAYFIAAGAAESGDASQAVQRLSFFGLMSIIQASGFPANSPTRRDRNDASPSFLDHLRGRAPLAHRFTYLCGLAGQLDVPHQPGNDFHPRAARQAWLRGLRDGTERAPPQGHYLGDQCKRTDLASAWTAPAARSPAALEQLERGALTGIHMG